jgi:acetoacetate decarboxylase
MVNSSAQVVRAPLPVLAATTGPSSFLADEISPDAQFRPRHVGIVARFLADPGYLEKLLPRPLEMAENTPEVSIFVNETVITTGAEPAVESEPSEERFREALIVIPCRYEGAEYGFHYLQYLTSEKWAYVSNFVGLWTKLASIDLMYAFPPSPMRAQVEPGACMKAVATRLGNRLLTVTFEAEREAEPDEVMMFRAPLVGMRYFPDLTVEKTAAPLVHDLVALELDDMGIAEAWAGNATLHFGDSEKEELYHLEPLEMLESYYMSGFTYINKGLTVLHDYLASE